MTLTIGSACAGYGGLDMGLSQVLDAEPIWFCEFAPGPSKILDYRYPGVPNYHDLTTTDWDSVDPVDIFSAGWPCQPWSLAGSRKGADDERAIWPAIADAIRRLRPRYVALENVPAIVGVGELARAVGDLAALGYDAQWQCIRASDVGAPHRRERCFILARDTSRRDEQWPSESSSGDWGVGSPFSLGGSGAATEDADRAARGERGFAASREAEVGRTWTDVGRRSGTSPSAADSSGSQGPGKSPRALQERTGESPGRQHTSGRGDAAADASSDGRYEGRTESAGEFRGLHAAVSSRPPAADPRGERLREFPGGASTEEAGSGSGHEPAGNRGPRPATDWGPYRPAIERWERAIGRPAPRPTELSRNGNERLSPLLVEWMMGLPEGWVTAVPDLSRNEQLKALGNGVVPQQAAAAYSSLLTQAVAA